MDFRRRTKFSGNKTAGRIGAIGTGKENSVLAAAGTPRNFGDDRHEFRGVPAAARSEEHTSELQSPDHTVCRLLLVKKQAIPALFRESWFTPALVPFGRERQGCAGTICKGCHETAHMNGFSTHSLRSQRPTTQISIT